MEHKLILRLLALRKAGKLGVILVEQGVYYIADDGPDVWGTKRRYTVAELHQLADMLEGLPEKQPVGSAKWLEDAGTCSPIVMLK